MSLSLNLESIILLLFFIAPGFLFTRTYTAYRPRYYREPTAFEQFVLAIVGSTIIHAGLLTAIAVLVLLYWGVSQQTLYLNNVFDMSVPLLEHSLPVIALLLSIGTVYLSLSLIAARRFASFLGQGSPGDRPRWWIFALGQDPPEPFLLWHTVLQIEPLRLNLIPPYLHIQMRNGEYFEGELYLLRIVGDEENSVELALRNVRYSASKAAGGQPDAVQPLTDQVLLLKSADILWLTRNDVPQ
ncbi:MAG: hypothetical protein KDJ52_05960 [Anaerolineae bacterium]|nr:hypothetical protein [Anaerolineae bacterium]